MTTDSPAPTTPSKGQQILDLMQRLRETLQLAAGGTDERVEDVFKEIEDVLK